MRYTLTEFAVKKIRAQFTTGNVVTITVLDRTNMHTEVLTSAACTEIGATGVFEWSFANLQTQPIGYTEFFWSMANVAGTTQLGSIEAGGWPDTLVGLIPAGGGVLAVETPVIWGNLPPGAAVTIALYDSLGAAVALTSNVCTELGVTGFFRWNTINITVYPATAGLYLWVMTDAGTGRQAYGDKVIGTPMVIADEVWDALRAAHTDVGSFGEGVLVEDFNAAARTAIHDQDQNVIEDNNLDHLMKVAVAGGDVVDGTALAALVSKRVIPDWSDFDNTTDSLEIISEKVTNTDANVGTPIVLDGHLQTISGMLTAFADDNGGADFNSATDSLHEIALGVVPAAVAAAVWDEDITAHTAVDSAGEAVNDILAQTNQLVFAGGDVVATLNGEQVDIGKINGDNYVYSTTCVGGELSGAEAVEVADSTGFAIGKLIELTNALGGVHIATIRYSNIGSWFFIPSLPWDILNGSVVKCYSQVAPTAVNTEEFGTEATQNLADLITDTAFAVWEELLSLHGQPGSAGLALDTLATCCANLPDVLADAVWDEVLADHLDPGSTGEALSNASSGGDPALIADAVWDEHRDEHVVDGSFGSALAWTSFDHKQNAVKKASAKVKIELDFNDQIVAAGSSIWDLREIRIQDRNGVDVTQGLLHSANYNNGIMTCWINYGGSRALSPYLLTVLIKATGDPSLWLSSSSFIWVDLDIG